SRHARAHPVAARRRSRRPGAQGQALRRAGLACTGLRDTRPRRGTAARTSRAHGAAGRHSRRSRRHRPAVGARPRAPGRILSGFHLDRTGRRAYPKIVVEDRRPGIDRREFLRRGTLLGIGASLAPGAILAATEAAPPGPPRIRAHRTLGRTGLEVSDIAFGSSRLGENEGYLVRHAFDCGVNYFGTAQDYT